MGIIEYFDTLSTQQIRELRHCRSIADGIMTSSVASMKIKWPYGQLDGACAGLILLSMIRSPNTNGFIKSWALQSIDKSPTGIDINESRFIKLIKADDWDEFYNAASIGVKLLSQRDKSVDKEDLIFWIKQRANEWEWPDKYNNGAEKFSFKAADVFYQHQRSLR